MPKILIVSGNPHMKQYLVDQGIVSPEVEHLRRAYPEDVRGAIVYGTLPMHLAALTHMIVVIPFHIDHGDKPINKWPLEQIQRRAKPPERYVVRTLEEYINELDNEWHIGREHSNDPLTEESYLEN